MRSKSCLESANGRIKTTGKIGSSIGTPEIWLDQPNRRYQGVAPAENELGA
jgi:hypothetical protein